jgi:hypothetical protein
VSGVGMIKQHHNSALITIHTIHTGRRNQSESTLQDIEIRHNMPDLDV